jgi:hypothetical protein
MNLRQFIFRQKFRLDLASGFLQYLNFTLVMFTAAKVTFGVQTVRWYVLAAVALALFVLWLFGYLLDKLKAQQFINRELNARNEMLKSISERGSARSVPSIHEHDCWGHGDRETFYLKDGRYWCPRCEKWWEKTTV